MTIEQRYVIDQAADAKVPVCPSCGSEMSNIGGRDRDGLFVTGFGCFDCEGWDVKFAGGEIVRIPEGCTETIFRPLGEMTRNN